jgi:hypothetical protein
MLAAVDHFLRGEGANLARQRLRRSVADSALYSALAAGLPPCHQRGVASPRPKRRSRGVMIKSGGVEPSIRV